MKNILFITFLLVTLGVKGQRFETVSNIITNDINYSVWRISPIVSDTIVLVPPKNVIHISISDSLKLRLREFSYETWVNLLEDTNSDWGANLVLYELYEKDATVFKVIKKREDWVRIYKNDDLSYWKKKLLTE